MTKSVVAVGLALSSIVVGCAGDPDQPVVCAEGQHDGGDGECVAADSCSPGYRLVTSPELACAEIVPGMIRYGGPGGGIAGATILFHDASGAFVDSGETDAEGRLANLLPRLDQPGFVTLVVPDEVLAPVVGTEMPTLQTSRTYPWDILLFDAWGPPPGSSERLSVSLPGPFEGAVSYSVDAGFVEADAIEDPDQPILLDVSRDDLSRGPPPVLAFALDADGVPLAWAGSTNPPGPDVALAEWSDSFADVEMLTYNPPPDSAGFAYVAGVIDGREYLMPPRIDVPALSSGGELPTPREQRYVRHFGYTIVVAGFDSEPGTRGVFAGPFSPRSGYPGYPLDSGLTIEIDLSTDLMPVVESTSIEPGDSGRPTLTWSSSGSADTRADIALRYASSSRDEVWYVRRAAEGGATSFTLPELPVDLRMREPVDVSTASLDVSLIQTSTRTELWNLYGPFPSVDSEPVDANWRLPPPDPRVWVTTTKQQ